MVGRGRGCHPDRARRPRWRRGGGGRAHRPDARAGGARRRGPDPPSRDPVERSTDRGRMRRDPRRDRSRPADPGHGQRRATRVHGAEAAVGPATRARRVVSDRPRPATQGPRSAPADRRSRRGPSRWRRDAPVRPREARLVERGRRRARDRPVVAATDVRGPGGDRFGLAGGRSVDRSPSGNTRGRRWRRSVGGRGRRRSRRTRDRLALAGNIGRRVHHHGRTAHRPGRPPPRVLSLRARIAGT